MSLLEDIFLQDEAWEAQELERIIEGDEFEERRRSDSENDSEKEDEAVEDKRRVDPAQAKPKRVVKNPRVILNPARLTGPRGIQVIPEHFKDFKFKGKGHEKEDLDLVLKKLEHWAYRLFPKFQFDDCLKKIETLGKKRPVMVHLQKIRSDQYQSDDVIVQKDSSDEETAQGAADEVEDEFDKLLGEQIELARAKVDTPGSNMKGFQTPSTVDKRTSLMMPKATSSPSISEEQKERMFLNRKLAEERRLARLKQNKTVTVDNDTSDVPNNTIEGHMSETIEIEEPTSGKQNRSNIIGSDNEQTKNDVIVDVGEVTAKNITRKQNKANIIDSDDDDVTETDVIINGSREVTRKQNRANLIDSDDEEKDNNVIEIAVSKKQNRATLIESSDEELVEDSVVTVDLHQEINKITHQNDKELIDQIDLTNVAGGTKTIANSEESNVTIDLVNAQTNKYIDNNVIIDITDQEYKGPVTGLTNIIDTVDLSNIEEYAENNVLTRRKSNKSAVIDSSDEECEITSTNNDIAVDIHENINMEISNEGHSSMSKDIEVSSKVDEDVQQCEKIRTPNEDKEISNEVHSSMAQDIEGSSKVDEDIQQCEEIRSSNEDKEISMEIQDLGNEVKSKSTDSCDDLLHKINTDIVDNKDISASIDNHSETNDSKTITENSVSDVKESETKDTVDIEELMDVDFSEDF